MKTVVVRNIPRASDKAIADLEECGVSTVHEAMGRFNLMKPYMRPVYSGATIAGSAVTLLTTPGDNCRFKCRLELRGGAKYNS